MWGVVCHERKEEEGRGGIDQLANLTTVTPFCDSVHSGLNSTLMSAYHRPTLRGEG